MMKPALFIDRDGTLNYNCPYCRNENEIKIYKDIFTPLKYLSRNYYIIIITNQSGIARKYFKLEDLRKMNNKIIKGIRKHGGNVDAIYFCPHLPQEKCNCRKPKIGMIKKACKDFEIDLTRSFIIGDDDKDIKLAKNVNVKSIRIRSKGSLKSDFFAEDFYDVLDIIKKGCNSGHTQKK